MVFNPAVGTQDLRGGRSTRHADTHYQSIIFQLGAYVLRVLMYYAPCSSGPNPGCYHSWISGAIPCAATRDLLSYARAGDARESHASAAHAAA